MHLVNSKTLLTLQQMKSFSRT